jgi:hypothetical protein
MNEASATYFFALATSTIGVLDSAFNKIDNVTLFNEVLALNIELFGLAWLNYNYEYEIYKQYSKPELLFAGEINSTKPYLINRGEKSIWDTMQFYNTVISKTYTEERTFDNWGMLRDIPIAIDRDTNSEARNKAATDQLISNFKLFEKHTLDDECKGRLSLRFMFVPYNMYTITRLLQNLSLSLTKRLGWEPTQVGLLAIQLFIAGLHQNAVSYLDVVSDLGSYEEFKKVRNKQISWLKSVANAYQAREQSK